jgi:hypothetical protein
LRVHHVVLAAVGIAAGVGGTMALREATLSTHQHVPRGTRALVVLDAETKGGEPGQSLDEMVEAVLQSCRLEVSRSDLTALRHEGDGRYTARYEPGMDRTNARQLRGCLEDWTVDHVRIDVLSFDRR